MNSIYNYKLILHKTIMYSNKVNSYPIPSLPLLLDERTVQIGNLNFPLSIYPYCYCLVNVGNNFPCSTIPSFNTLKENEIICM